MPASVQLQTSVHRLCFFASRRIVFSCASANRNRTAVALPVLLTHRASPLSHRPRSAFGCSVTFVFLSVGTNLSIRRTQPARNSPRTTVCTGCFHVLVNAMEETILTDFAGKFNLVAFVEAVCALSSHANAMRATRTADCPRLLTLDSCYLIDCASATCNQRVPPAAAWACARPRTPVRTRGVIVCIVGLRM